MNDSQGDELRDKLARNIFRWRSAFLDAGFASADPIYPVQMVRVPDPIDPEDLDTALRARGLRVQLQRREDGQRLFAVITAALDEAEVEASAHALLETLQEVASRYLWT